MPMRFYLRATHSIWSSIGYHLSFLQSIFFSHLYDKNFVGMSSYSTKASASDRWPSWLFSQTSPKHFERKEQEAAGVKGKAVLRPLKLRTGFGSVGCRSEPLLSSLLRRMPQLETLEIVKLVNCPETFTPDMRCIMEVSLSAGLLRPRGNELRRPFVWWRSWKVEVPSHSDWACWASSFLVHMVCDVLSPYS